MVLRKALERRGVGGLSERSDTARAGRGLCDRPVGCDVGGSAARFVEAEDELWVTGTPGAMELRLVAVAAGGVPPRPPHRGRAAVPLRPRPGAPPDAPGGPHPEAG